MSDNTRQPFNPSPAAVKLARSFEQYALVGGFETLGDIIITVKAPLMRYKAERIYETFFREAGNGVSALVLNDCIEIKMPKAVYKQRFTPVS